MTEKIRFGARLRAARKAAGFRTALEFIKKNKIPASTYSQYESGARTPDDSTLRFYSKAFDVDFIWLKEGKGHPFSKSLPEKKNTLNEELLHLKISKNTPKLLSEIIRNSLNTHLPHLSKQISSKIIKNAVSNYIYACNNKAND